MNVFKKKTKNLAHFFKYLNKIIKWRKKEEFVRTVAFSAMIIENTYE
jgi:hypothetical protein